MTTTDSKERDAFEAHWLREGNPRNSLAKWQDADNVPPKMRGAYVMACTRDAWSAFQAGRASLAASAGSEPVAGMNEYGVRGYLAATLKCWHRLTGDEAAELVAMTQRLAGLYLHRSPPEGMVMVPKEPTMAMRIAAKTADMDHTNLSDWMVSDWPEFKRIWDAMLKAAPPTSSADSRKGE